MEYILAVDLGSSQMKLMLMDENKNNVCTVSEEYPTQVKNTNYVEQNPKDWERALGKGIQRLGNSADMQKVSAISFSGHMSGVVLVDREGTPVYPCIMLSDSRSMKQCTLLKKKSGEMIKKRTGNPVNNAFSLPKILWLKENERDIYDHACAWISPKDYIRSCLTGEIASEYTDAYNSLCMDGEHLTWDKEIIEASGVDEYLFPEIKSPFEKCGYVTGKAAVRFGLKNGIPVFAGGADMACAAFGSGLFENGDSVLTLGTSATYLCVVPKISEKYYGQITFHPHILKGKKYALGSHINGGAAINWMSMLFSEGDCIDYNLVNRLSEAASDVPAGSGGIVTLPFLLGSGSPRFSPADRQHVLGIKMSTTKAELFRSELEGVTYNLKQTFQAFQELTGVSRLLLGGGGIKVKVWPQIIADIFGVSAEIFRNPDVSACGAAFIGGVGAGIFRLEEVCGYQSDKTEILSPNEENRKEYERMYQRYIKYYELMHQIDSGDENDR